MTDAVTIPVGIAGIGFHVPERRISNDYFTQFIETSDEWIQTRTGIKERRWLADDEAPSDLFREAGRNALADAGVAPEDVDLIIVGTVSGDYQSTPSAACLVQRDLGCVNAAAFDISAACAGFVFGLNVGRQFIAGGTYKNVLVIGGEGLSRISDIQDRNSVIIFADGAGAALLQPHEVCQQGLIEDMTLGTDGEGWHYIIRPRGGPAEPLTPEIMSEGTNMLRMKGREVYRFAVDKMAAIMSWAMEGHDLDDLGIVIPHQVNARILETATQKIGIPPEKVMINIDRFGNTSAGSCPIALCEARDTGRLVKGKLIVMAAFGAGLVWGGARIRW